MQEFSINHVELFTYALKSPESQKQYPRTFKMFLDFIDIRGNNSGEQPMSIFSRANILEAFQGRKIPGSGEMNPNLGMMINYLRIKYSEILLLDIHPLPSRHMPTFL